MYIYINLYSSRSKKCAESYCFIASFYFNDTDFCSISYKYDRYAVPIYITID